MKALKRIGQKKQQFKITLVVHKIGAEVEEDCLIKAVWKRGPQEDTTEKYDLNPYEPDVEANHTFSRISSFYTNDGGKTYDKKLCDFQMILENEKDQKETVIAILQGYNMAQFINKPETKEKIEFPDSKRPNTFMEVTWNIKETDEQQVDLKVDQMQLEHGLSFSVQGQRYTSEQIKDFIDERDELQDNLNKVDQNMNFILSAKLDMEVRYKELKRTREKYEEMIDQIKPTLKSNEDKLDTLLKQK